MVKESSESRIAKLKKLKSDNIDSFLPKDIVCVDDYEELSVVFKNTPITTEKFKLVRKKIEKRKR
ncbi:MAG TPA: hypothetical protein PKH80_01035 [Methanofastidiosum sp.]|jgi:hypothetical protein|nr:hypothetical protein [Methanofastidiosum sp.]HNU61284.1 hypothetical protein [Methanofastidiosum sp.]